MHSFRSWTRRAYVLHGYLIAGLVLLPFPPGRLTLVAEEEPPPEEVWSLDHAEARLDVALSSPAVLPATPWSTVELQAAVTRTTWEVWTSNQGHVELRAETTVPVPDLTLNWTQDAGDGYWAASTPQTDSAGKAAAAYFVRDSTAVVRVEVSGGQAGSALATLTLDVLVPETWTQSGSGSALSVEWLPVEEGVTGLAQGAQRTLRAQVWQHSWEVWTSNLGNTQNRHAEPQAASFMPVIFTIESGDGTLVSPMVFTDGQGVAAASFTMGALDTVAGVVAAGSVPAAPLTLTAEVVVETWTPAQPEITWGLALQAENDPAALPPNSVQTFHAEVTRTTREVFVSNLGHTAHGEPVTQPVNEAVVCFTADDAWQPADRTWTGSTGRASFTWPVGTAPQRLQAAVVDSSGSVLAEAALELTPTPEEWSLGSTESTVIVELETDGTLSGMAPGAGCVVTATVRGRSWEVWVSNLGGVELRNAQESALQGAQVDFGLEGGDGVLGATTAATDSEGRVQVVFTMGRQATRLRADAWWSGTVMSAAALDFDPLPTWEFERREGGLVVEMRHDAAESRVTAQVSYESWDVYVLSTDPSQTQNRNPVSSPASGAQVGFSIGSGVVETPAVAGDENGSGSTRYTAAEATEVTAQVTYAGLTQSASVAVAANALRITTAELPAGIVGADYSTGLAAAGGTGPYAFAVDVAAGGTGLPAGYQLYSNGTLSGSGSPQTGTYTFTAEVTDSAGQSAGKAFTLVLGEAGWTGGGSGGTTTGQQGGGGATTTTGAGGTTTTNNTPPGPPPVITLAGRANTVSFGYTPPQSTSDHRYGASETEKNQLLMEGWESAPLLSSDPAMLQLYLNDSGELVPPTWHLIRNQSSGDFYSHDVKKFDDDSPQPILSDEAIRALISNNESGPDITERLQFQPPEPAKPGNSTSSPAMEASRGSETIGESVFQKGSWGEFWLKASGQVPEPVSRTYLIRKTSGSGGTPQITAVTLTIPKNGTYSTQGGDNGTIKLHPAEGESMSLVPVELILDSNNIAYKPDSEALGVSNYVTNNELPATSQFNDTNPDPENFRLQARLPNATTNSIVMKLEVKRDGAVVSTTNHTLDQKSGDFVRGKFLRLVTDTDDDAVSGDQTILVKLGDKIKVSYDMAGAKAEQEIQVGRPSSEDNNEADKPWKHDIREVKVRIVAVKDEAGNACVTDAKVNELVDNANERLAQSGIRLKRTQDTVEVIAPPSKPADDVGPAYTYDQNFQDGNVSGNLTSASEDEIAFSRSKDSDSNTIDIFFVKHVVPSVAIAYYSSQNNTGKPALSNFIVIDANAARPFTMPHEIMHILLNRGHRNFEPSTALFYSPTSQFKTTAGKKRIGPYPQSKTNNVGDDDTTTLRANAETLP